MSEKPMSEMSIGSNIKGIQGRATQIIAMKAKARLAYANANEAGTRKQVQKFLIQYRVYSAKYIAIRELSREQPVKSSLFNINDFFYIRRLYKKVFIYRGLFDKYVDSHREEISIDEFDNEKQYNSEIFNRVKKQFIGNGLSPGLVNDLTDYWIKGKDNFLKTFGIL